MLRKKKLGLAPNLSVHIPTGSTEEPSQHWVYMRRKTRPLTSRSFAVLLDKYMQYLKDATSHFHSFNNNKKRVPTVYQAPFWDKTASGSISLAFSYIRVSTEVVWESWWKISRTQRGREQGRTWGGGVAERVGSRERGQWAGAGLSKASGGDQRGQGLTREPKFKF